MVAQQLITTLAVVSTSLFASTDFAASRATVLNAALPTPLQVVRPEEIKDQAQGRPSLRLAQATSSEDDAYKALTGNVINAIRNLDKATDPSVSDTLSRSEKAAGRLRGAIQELVRHADDNGKSTDYIAKLIDEAVSNSSVNIPAALLGSDGKLDTSLLVQSVVSRSLAEAAEDADTDYLAALDEEAESTGASVKAVPKPKDRPKFIVVSEGETLGGIAWKFYGDSLFYVKIFNANKDKLQDPNHVYAGIRLRLP